MKALLVDDHALFREGLALLISQHFQEVELLQAERLQQAITMVKHHVDLDVVLLDLALPDSNGVDALPRLHEATANARIVVLSADDSADTVRGAIENGAAGFISKTAQGSTLRAALDVILGGGVYLPGSPPQHLAGGPEPALDLSPRQFEVLHLLIRGATNKHICRELSMAESTVKTHLAVIFRRLEVSNRTQAVFAAARLGLRQPAT